MLCYNQFKMSSSLFEKQLLSFGEKNNSEQLKSLIDKTSVQILKDGLTAKLGRSDCAAFWNYLLRAFMESNSYEAKEKRFACVKCLLDGLLKVELSYKQTYDLITRLCQDLPTFASDELVEILEHCVDSLRTGDPKCVGWKDLLPETLKVLSQLRAFSVNAISISGTEFRNTTLRNLCTMRWPTEVLTPIADMFKELNLGSSELMTVLNKFSGCLQSLAPPELPALAFQLFSMCSTAAQIIVPILAFEKYFYRFYYKKLFADMNSNSTDFDSIEAFSDKELREAEETILHHLNYCTQYKISEIQMCIVLRNFLSMPDVILTPFVLSAMLSMTAVNREPESSRLSTSVLLAFLRNAIKNNEDERHLAESSVWCRDCLQRKQVDLELIFTVLIDQNKEGKDVVTPGLVNLAFVLLKAKSNKVLNALAIGFLTKFIRKRFIFGQGVVKKLAEWMIVEQDQYQYSECLTMLSVADTFTVSECVKTINYVMEFFLWIPGEQAMRMMSFILPVLKISGIVRDAFIEVLRKAMSSSDEKLCRMGVYGFCMILKQLNNSNSQRSQLGVSGICTQQNISGFSLMSQATLGNPNNPQRHFNMLTLEIIGLLRKCFNHTLEIKRTLYENLQRAVELNPKLVPHILQFIDWHFRSYFIASSADAEIGDDDVEFSVNFDKIVRSLNDNENELEVNDNLGRLIQFVSHCLVIFDKFEGDYNTGEMKRLLNLSVTKVIAKELKFEQLSGQLTHRKNETVAQQLNFIEGLMAYSILTSTQGNDNVKNLLPLFKEHQKLHEALKSLPGANSKKGPKKAKNPNESEGHTVVNVTINGTAVKRINPNAENIWDFPVIEKFLRLLHDDVVPFAAPENTSSLRSNCELVRYLLRLAAVKVEGIRLEPEYKQLAHSRRMLKHLTDITKVVYERCIKRLPMLWRDFDLKAASAAAECFQQCLVTANAVYKKKFVDTFVQGFDFHSVNRCQEAPAILHEVLDEFMKEDSTAQADESMMNDADGRKIPQALLNCLEVLYDNISYSNRMTTESYTWLLKFCKENEVNTKELSLVHKLLFVQRQKTHSGAFFNTVALHLRAVLGAINDDDDEADKEKSTPKNQRNPTPELSFQLKSITVGSAESCLNYLYAALRKQIEDVDYFITKANNFVYKYRIVAEDDRDLCLASLRSLERSICSQLVHISNTLLNLTNCCIPLGTCMDSLLRLLMQHFICLKNLAKHFINRCTISQLTIHGTKFDLLLHAVGKPLPTHVYALITYIEANIFENQRKKKLDPQVEKAKVLRETKLIPKIVLCIENFNKHVILLAKKTNDRLANFLHFGTVRDFRIKTSELKAAIDRTLSHSSQIEVEPSDPTAEQTEEDNLLARMEAECAATNDDHSNLDEEEEEEAVSSMSSRSTTPSAVATTSAAAAAAARAGLNLIDDDEEELTTPENVLEGESNRETSSQLLKNLAKINKKSKAKKRALKETADPDVNCAPPIPKKRRGRPAKK